MSGQDFASGAKANMNAYGNMAAQGTPQMGPLMGYKPEVPAQDFDLKGPLANMAFSMFQQQLQQQPRQPFNPLQPVPVYGGMRGPVQMGRLYGGY
jgi:hypothetical protein